MRVLVSGGSGFVGRHIAQHCWGLGYDVTVVDNLSAVGSYVDSRFELVASDFRYWCQQHPNLYDLVFHCAAVVGGRQTIEGDPLKVAIDLSIDAEFFNWLVKTKHRSQRVVYFSSSAVYPIELQQEKSHCKLVETLVNFFDGHRFSRPDMTYGWAKLTGEYLAKQAVEKYDIPVVIYRPFSGYGEDQDLTYPVPAIVDRVVRGENPVTIWGSGKQTRDFIHIDDVVDCVFTTMNQLQPGEVLNIGTGTGTTFQDIVKFAGWLPSATVVFDTTKPEGVMHRVADTYKMNRFFVPKISRPEGIARVVEYRKNLLAKSPAAV